MMSNISIPPRVSVKDSIATKLLKAVFSFYLVLTVAVTLTHMVAEYSHTKESVVDELRVVQYSFEPGLARALWDLNQEQLESIFLGMIGIPTVIGVRIEDEQGRIVGSIGRVESSAEPDKPTGMFGYTAPVYFLHNGKRIKVGKVTSYSSTSVVIKRVQLGFAFIIVNAIIKTVALWGLFLWIGRKLLTRPLAELTLAASRLDMENLEEIKVRVDSGGRNELKVLEEAFNNMVVNLQVAREKIRREVCERREADERVRQLNRDLEGRVAARTAELEQSLATIKNAQRQLVESEKMAALGGLVAGVAHEINTPVGIGITMSSYLEEKTSAIASRYASSKMGRKEFEEFLETVSESARSISTNLTQAGELVKSFKQVAVDQTSERRREFKLKQYIEDVIASLHVRFKKTGHTIDVRCSDDIQIDSFPGAFSQVITNLLMNSLMHGFDGIQEGKITLEVAMEERYLSFRYSDDGRGMASADLKRIFDPFFTTRRTQGGTGLGMHIVYNLVTLRLNGTIACESAPEEGITFTIRIPLNELERRHAM